MIKVICGWCRKEIIINEKEGKSWGYGTRVCPECGRTITSSKKEYTGNVTGRKHIHRAYKKGEVVD